MAKAEAAKTARPVRIPGLRLPHSGPALHSLSVSVCVCVCVILFSVIIIYNSVYIFIFNCYV